MMGHLIAISGTDGLGGCGCRRGVGQDASQASLASQGTPLVTIVSGGILLLALGFCFWGDQKMRELR